MPRFAVILPAAGRSSRFGGKEKKPFASLDGRPVWLRTAELFVTRDDVCQCVIVVSPDDMEMFKTRYGANLAFLDVRAVEGGRERFESVGDALQRCRDLGERGIGHVRAISCVEMAVCRVSRCFASQRGGYIVRPLLAGWNVPLPETQPLAPQPRRFDKPTVHSTRRP